MAANALSDWLRGQERILELEEEAVKLKKKMIKFTGPGSHVERMGTIEDEAQEVLKEDGQIDYTIKNHVGTQQISDEKRKGQVKRKSSN